jgi:hypothetical protein
LGILRVVVLGIVIASDLVPASGTGTLEGTVQAVSAEAVVLRASDGREHRLVLDQRMIAPPPRRDDRVVVTYDVAEDGGLRAIAVDVLVDDSDRARARRPVDRGEAMFTTEGWGLPRAVFAAAAVLAMVLVGVSVRAFVRARREMRS